MFCLVVSTSRSLIFCSQFYFINLNCHPQVKAQHQERCVDFLVKELKVNTTKEAEERVFFVSARETLQVRNFGFNYCQWAM